MNSPTILDEIKVPPVIAVAGWGWLTLNLLGFVIESYTATGAFGGSNGSGGNDFPAVIKRKIGKRKLPRHLPPKPVPHTSPSPRPHLPPIPGFPPPLLGGKRARRPGRFREPYTAPGLPQGAPVLWFDPRTGEFWSPNTGKIYPSLPALLAGDPASGVYFGGGSGSHTSHPITIPAPGTSPLPGLPAIPPTLALP